ncbi:hypothetical protein KSP40_PGU006021 [Platanthera guangdongensis]|uniref:Uncharacterized protein n=1 Tax=Platanthera guangdongensis TaxID=2320717 RepID=A0ABR2LNZ3_9ASPA
MIGRPAVLQSLTRFPQEGLFAGLTFSLRCRELLLRRKSAAAEVGRRRVERGRSGRDTRVEVKWTTSFQRTTTMPASGRYRLEAIGGRASLSSKTDSKISAPGITSTPFLNCLVSCSY